MIWLYVSWRKFESLVVNLVFYDMGFKFTWKRFDLGQELYMGSVCGYEFHLVETWE